MIDPTTAAVTLVLSNELQARNPQIAIVTDLATLTADLAKLNAIGIRHEAATAMRRLPGSQRLGRGSRIH